ncbi:Hypothetical protein MSYG_2924 [Malassezia sympodialis ATCC 42132]|mgnify:CR=1 FL=1|uniref:Uncharacterized protein n=1 Tax=Malassezia sympodialis (strain ATCC 42132) TaxID=1230383 RepID=A0A1M8A8B8_MALS4|nr:Hypothetical protein MSYG_2924 [Malassezia sympodialis ATCC 42132]
MPNDASPPAAPAPAPSTPVFSWQKGLDSRIARYRELMALATPAETPAPRTPPSAARLQRGHDRFAVIERVWDKAVATPAPTPPPHAKRRRVARTPRSTDAHQTTLDAYRVRSASPETPARSAPHTTQDAPASPETPARSAPHTTKDAPASPDSLSSCSSVPGDSGDELPSPARAWLRMLGSSPTEW